MRIIGNCRIRRAEEGVSYGSGNNIQQLTTWDLAGDDDAATVEATGFFNAMAKDFQKGDVIRARLDVDATPRLKSYIVTAVTASTVTIAPQTVA